MDQSFPGQARRRWPKGFVPPSEREPGEPSTFGLSDGEAAEVLGTDGAVVAHPGDQSEPEAPAPEGDGNGPAALDPSDVPETVAAVVAWIDDAEGADREARARAALAVEKAKGDKARKGITDHVAGVLTPAE
jgi:hypothetical protein